MQLNNKVKVLKERDVEKHLKKINPLTIMEQTFSALSKNMVVQPPQTLALFPENRGDFITYLGALSHLDIFGAKLSPYIPTSGAPIITAWTILMSMKTGQPLMLCDSARLTRERTAATTALAVNLLASKNSKVLALIGTGEIGRSHLLHTLNLRAWQEIRIYSANLAKDKKKQRSFKNIDPRIVVCNSSESCIDQADVVMLCTSSGQPVIDTRHISKHSLITSISTNVAQAHEIEPKALLNMDVYCDYKETTPETAGEMVLATKYHHWSSRKIVGDLSELCLRKCALPDYKRPVFFRSVGLGIEDVAMAHAIYNQLLD